MDSLNALFLGIIQGLTEFLPVSSSGHLEFGKILFGTDFENTLAFAVIVHLATACSVLLLFRKDIAQLIHSFFKEGSAENRKFIYALIISSFPVLVIYILFNESIDSLFTGNPFLLSIYFFLTTLILLLSHPTLLRFTKSKLRVSQKEKNEIGISNALFIGFAQALAIFPGVSRSGTTIVAGLYAGIGKELIARFSFLMSLIPILGASGLQILEIMSEPTSAQSFETSLFIGFASSFITGVIAIKFMLSTIKKGKLYYFAPYTFLLSLVTFLIAQQL